MSLIPTSFAAVALLAGLPAFPQFWKPKVAPATFSTRPFEGGQPATATRFQPGDPIYVQAQFDRPLSEVKGNADGVGDLMQVALGDESGTRILHYPIRPDQLGARAYTFALVPPSVDPRDPNPKEVLEQLQELASGKAATIEVTVGARHVAKGTFTLDLSRRLGGYERLLRVYQEAKRLPEPGLRDEELEGRLLVLAKKAGPARGYIVIRTLIESPDWQVNLHPATGLPTSRTLSVRFLAKDAKGACLLLKTIAFQDPADDESWGRLRLGDLDHTVPEPYPCAAFEGR